MRVFPCLTCPYVESRIPMLGDVTSFKAHNVLTDHNYTKVKQIEEY